METLSDDGNEDIGGNGDPDLGLYRIVGSAVEGLDAEMLFDPFEEQFDLPSALVEFGDGQRRKDEIVGQKNELFFPFGVEVFYTTEFFRITCLRFGCDQHDGLIAFQAVGSIHRMRVDSSEPRVFLGPCNEKGEELSKDVEPFEVQVTAVHDVEGSRFWNQDVKDIDVMERSIGDFDKRGDVAAEVHEGVHFDGGLMLAKRRPGKEGQAKVDGRRIQGVGGFFEFDAKVFIGVKGSRLGNQDLAEVGIHPPVPFFVRLGKGAPRYSSSDAEMIELLPAGTEAGLNIPEALPVGQLREGHAKILIHTGETACVVIAVVPVNAFAKFIHRHIVHDL